jgi:hypothetical protein
MHSQNAIRERYYKAYRRLPRVGCVRVFLLLHKLPGV